MEGIYTLRRDFSQHLSTNWERYLPYAHFVAAGYSVGPTSESWFWGNVDDAKLVDFESKGRVVEKIFDPGSYPGTNWFIVHK